MSSVLTGALAYASGLCTVFGLYPYRDFVKTANVRHLPSFKDFGEFCAERYRGMLKNPAQPLLLATPQSGLYFGYVLGGGSIPGAIVGGFFFGYLKIFVRTVAFRMSREGGRYNKLHHKGYSGVVDCVTSSARHYGIWSFFPGAFAVSLISVLWHGISLAVLQQNYNTSFGSNFWDAFRIHALMTFLTSPLRNTFRSATYGLERAGGVHHIRTYIASEVSVFNEAGGVFYAMARSEGLRFFMNGSLRTTLKTSVPFAVSYAIFRSFGGSIGLPNGGYYRGGGGHGAGHYSRRHF